VTAERRPLEGARVLVVGGAGFVGSNLVRLMLDQGVGEVIVVDNFLSSEPENLPQDSRVRLITGSINDDSVLAGLPEGLRVAFHLATYHGNQSSIADPLADHEHNTLTTLNLLERFAGMSRPPERIVYASAGCTVAEKTFSGARPTTEDAPVSLWLDSPYQISKIIGEYYCNYYFSRHGLAAVKARFQNVYGPGEVLGAGVWRGTANTVWRNVTPTFIYKALKHEALPVENGGIATRDLIYVDDLVHGLIACALRGAPGGVYNLASGREIAIRELAEMINKLTDSPTPIELAPARDWDHSGQRYGDPTKARAELDFEATTKLREGLSRTIEWTRANLGMIDACIARHADKLAEHAADVATAA
jgi:nucleoside-diphosphate-sugar epimerase